ncbi:MAG: rhomboid family intramembrane serine protease [Patescibacteria group bacterium]
MFIYQAGPEVESRMSRTNFIRFFIGSTIFVAIALAVFSSGVTIGMSGFCMALLSYLWVDLYTTRHPMANQILIMLVLNILLGLSGNISFVGHLAGAIW